MSKFVDVHSHWFPASYSARFESYTGRKAWPLHADSLQDRIADLDAAGIETQVVGLGHNQPYFADTQGAIDCSRFANDLYSSEISKFGGRFKAFGAVPLPHVPQALDEAKRCLDELGFAGIGIGATALGQSLDVPAFEPFWQELNRRQAVVFVHPTGAPDSMSTGVADFMLGPKFAGPHELAVAVIRLVVSGLTTHHPDIRWILAATGGTLPYLWRRFEEVSESIGQKECLRYDILTELKKMYYDTTHSDDPRVFDYVAATVGVNALVLGTDAPRVKAADWVSRIRRGMKIGAPEFEAVLGRTAREKLGL